MQTVARLTGKGRQILVRSLQALGHWPWFDTLKTLRMRFREDHLALTASSLTFTTLISLVPLMTVMLALFTANSGSEAQIDQLNQPQSSGTAQFNLRNLGLGRMINPASDIQA